MANKPKKTGKPKALMAEEEARPSETIEAFVKEMFGEGTTLDIPQNGLPPLEWLKSQFQTKSAVIRYLVHEGYSIKEISKHLGIKYQHVRNVATQTLKRGPNEDWRPKHLRERTPKYIPPTDDSDNE